MSSLPWWSRARHTSRAQIKRVFGEPDTQERNAKRLPLAGTAIAASLLWGGAILLVELINRAGSAH